MTDDILRKLITGPSPAPIRATPMAPPAMRVVTDTPGVNAKGPPSPRSPTGPSPAAPLGQKPAFVPTGEIVAAPGGTGVMHPASGLTEAQVKTFLAALSNEDRATLLISVIMKEKFGRRMS